MGKPAQAPQGMRHLPKETKQGGIADQSKKINKRFQKNVLTDQSVKNKAKSHRLVVPTSRMK